MKINGIEIDRNEKHVVGPYPIQRGEKVFGIYAQPVWDFDEFDEKCPAPVAPQAFTKDGKKPDTKNPAYREQRRLHDKKREGYLILKSLEPSGLELDDGISLDNPDSWDKVVPALRGKLFSFFEFNAVMRLVDEACGIDAAKIEENKQTFLSQRRQSSQAPTEATNS